MKLAVVVPARDEQARLPACLDSLAPFSAAGDPIVVVDNGSSDATGAIARERRFETIVEPQAGRGRAVAAGYRAVRERAPWVLVIHADMIVAAGTREAMAAAIDASPEAVTGALGHRIADRRLVFRAVEAGNRESGSLRTISAAACSASSRCPTMKSAFALRALAMSRALSSVACLAAHP